MRLCFMLFRDVILVEERKAVEVGVGLALIISLSLSASPVNQSWQTPAILNMAMWYNRGGGKEYEVTVRRSERRVN